MSVSGAVARPNCGLPHGSWPREFMTIPYWMGFISPKVPYSWWVCYHRFVCLFVWGFSSHLKIFPLYGDVTIAGEEPQIKQNTQHSWPLWMCILFMIFKPLLLKGNSDLLWTSEKDIWFIIPSSNEVAEVFSDPYVRPFVRSSVRLTVCPSLPISNPLLL